MLIESPLGSAFEDLERLIDEQTPYFKARIEELPVQARKVFDCLAEGWRPMLAKELAGPAKLTSSHVSAQLKQLVEKGYAREVRLPAAKRVRYEVSDRFYNIYYLLRFSRAGRDRLERLVDFLHDLFGSAGMRTMYPKILATLRGDGIGAGDLTVGSGRLYLHGKFEEAEAACRKAVDLEPENGKSWSVLAQAILFQKDDARLPEAEACARRAVEIAPEDPSAFRTLSDVLAWRGQWGESLDQLEHALDIGGGNFWEREWAGLTESLIPAVAAGHGRRVKQMMESAGLVEPMEPLWHAIRAELGEELEPLPAEIMDAVAELRLKFAQNRRGRTAG